MEQTKLSHHSSGSKSVVTTSRGAARHYPRRTSFSDKRGERLLFQVSVITEVLASPNYFLFVFEGGLIGAWFVCATNLSKSADVEADVADARNLGLDLRLSRATKERYDRVIAEGFGELDQSGIAELTFKDRHTFRRS